MGLHAELQYEPSSLKQSRQRQTVAVHAVTSACPRDSCIVLCLRMCVPLALEGGVEKGRRTGREGREGRGR